MKLKVCLTFDGSGRPKDRGEDSCTVLMVIPRTTSIQHVAVLAIEIRTIVERWMLEDNVNVFGVSSSSLFLGFVRVKMLISFRQGRFICLHVFVCDLRPFHRHLKANIWNLRIRDAHFFCSLRVIPILVVTTPPSRNTHSFVPFCVYIWRC